MKRKRESESESASRFAAEKKKRKKRKKMGGMGATAMRRANGCNAASRKTNVGINSKREKRGRSQRLTVQAAGLKVSGKKKKKKERAATRG